MEETEIFQIAKLVISSLQSGNIPACVIGETTLNYYNVPRVVHDLEICVPEDSLSSAVSLVCSACNFRLADIEDYDIYTEYKKGFPTLMAPQSALPVVIFPDSYFHLSPLCQSIVSYEERQSLVCSRQILDLVPRDELHHLPVPYLPAFFIGLCRRFLESNDYMSRIAAEQLVDAMNLDDKWIRSNLNGAPPKVRELAAQLVAEKPSRCEEYLGRCDFDSARVEDLALIPGSGNQCSTVELPLDVN